MLEITRQRRDSGLDVFKYHGHWAFTRYGGLEEPASVLFSLLNAMPHALRLAKRREASDKAHPYFMSAHLSLYPFVAITTWLASAVFHAHKTPLTTLVDYCCALVFLCYGLWLTLRRVLGSPARAQACLVFALGLGSLWTRLRAMCSGRVSYDAHMHTCIAVAAATMLSWLAWFAHQLLWRSGEPHPYNKFRCVLCQAGFGAASLLELFDFPPVWLVLDAHALWHLATVPLGFVWYDFWDADEANMRAREQSQYKPKAM